MLNYFITFIGLFSSLLFFIAFMADIINSKNTYSSKNEKDEITRAKYKIILALLMSLSWSYFLI